MKRLSWIELTILPLAMAALNVCWLALWERWVVAAANITREPAVSSWLMLVTILAGAYVTRYAVASAHDNLHLQRARRTVAVSGLAAVAAVLWITFGARFPFQYIRNFTGWGGTFSAEALAFVIALILWWRSIRIGRSDDLHETAEREFFGGATALVVLFVLNKFHPAVSATEAFWFTMTFFAIGLGALALAGLEQDRRLQKGSAGAGLGVNHHWLATVGGIIGLILVGGAMVAAATVPETITALDAWLDAIGLIIITIIGLFIILLVWLTLPIAQALARALWVVLQQLLLWLPRSFPFTFQPPTIEGLTATAQSLARTPSFRALEVILLMLFAAFLFTLAVRRFRLLASHSDADEIRESILSRELLRTQLMNLLGHRKAQTGTVPPPFLLLDGPPDDPRLVVRRAYQRMLEWAQTRHAPRAPAQTPLDYAQALCAVVPQAKEHLAALTNIYIRARYGLDISVEDAHRAAATVGELKEIGSEKQATTIPTTRPH